MSRFKAFRSQAFVNGEPVIELSSEMSDQKVPFLSSIQILPGRGMNLFQMRGWHPEMGELDLMHAQKLVPGENIIGEPSDDFLGNLSFSQGGAFLIPYANRIRGELSSDKKSLEVSYHGKSAHLPANWKGNLPAAVKHAMHGLILAARVSDMSLSCTDNSATAFGNISAGDFKGQWFSQTELSFEISLKVNLLDIIVTAKNIGQYPEPMGVGWHPYFLIPSRRREQCRLHLPAEDRLLVNNYDDVFPTGESVPVTDTAYDFSQPQGKSLDQLYLDDCFVKLSKNKNDHVVAEMVDPASQYGLRLTAISPEITAFQVYAPTDKPFIALEPQFNLADPFNGDIWKNQPTGMISLKPGQSTRYHVQVSLFRPGPDL